MKSLLAHPERRNERRDGDWRARGRKFRSEGRMRDASEMLDGRTDRPTGMMAWPPSASPQTGPIIGKEGGREGGEGEGGVTAEIGEKRGALETLNLDD